MSAATLLIVDDEDLVLWSLRQRLEPAGYTIIEAHTAADAVRQVNASVDLVLLDQTLRDEEGVNALKGIREASPDVAIILMADPEAVGHAVEAMKHGVWQCVRKPLNLDEMSLAIERALEVGLLRHEIRTLRAAAEPAAGFEAAVPPSLFRLPAEGVNLADVERQLLVQALERSRWNQTHAGALLKINRDQVRYRIEKFGLRSNTRQQPAAERPLEEVSM